MLLSGAREAPAYMCDSFNLPTKLRRLVFADARHSTAPTYNLQRPYKIS